MAMASPTQRERGATQACVAVSPSPLPLPQVISATPSAEHPEVWTDLCISILLEEYESVFVGLGRGHLRLKDWDAVCSEVNRRSHGSRTPEQCKAKIDNLKKHYRRERLKCSTSPVPRVSRWIFYNKLRQLAGDPLPSCPTLAQSFPDVKASAPLQNGPKKWDTDDVADASASADDFRNKDCGKVPEVPVVMLTEKNAREQDMHGAALDVADEHPSPNGAVEAVDSPKSQPSKMSRKSNAKNREMNSLGRDLKEALSSFSAVIEKIEKTKMELMVLLQTQCLEQERQHVEMEMERTRLIVTSQLDLAKLICVSSMKDSNIEEDGNDRKRGRWETVPDAEKCAKKCENDTENMYAYGEEIIEHERQLENSGKCNNRTPFGSQTPSPGLRRDSLQHESEALNFKANVVSNGSQDFKNNGFESMIQNCRRNESANCAVDCREDEARNGIQQDNKHLTHWGTGGGIMHIEHLNN